MISWHAAEKWAVSEETHFKGANRQQVCARNATVLLHDSRAAKRPLLRRQLGKITGLGPAHVTRLMPVIRRAAPCRGGCSPTLLPSALRRRAAGRCRGSVPCPQRARRPQGACWSAHTGSIGSKRDSQPTAVHLYNLRCHQRSGERRLTCRPTRPTKATATARFPRSGYRRALLCTPAIRTQPKVPARSAPSMSSRSRR